MRVPKAGQDRISAAIRAAEARCSGQIVCVLAQGGRPSLVWPLALAAILALVSPWAMVQFTQWPVVFMFLAQTVLFATAFLILSLPQIAILLESRKAQRARAHAIAAEQFLILKVSQTLERNGVMIFVSSRERYVRILADCGLDEKISDAEWKQVVDIMSGHLKQQQPEEAFCAAIAAAGELLARHFPPREGASINLPDGLRQI